MSQSRDVCVPYLSEYTSICVKSLRNSFRSFKVEGCSHLDGRCMGDDYALHGDINIYGLANAVISVGVMVAAAPAPNATVANAFIVKLDISLELFYQRAAGLDYSVRHEFDSEAFSGLSVNIPDEELQHLQGISGVAEVFPVLSVPHPGPSGSTTDVSPNTRTLREREFLNVPLDHQTVRPREIAASTANLASANEMGGVDKLHQKGIKGKGIKIGIIDTGVDYRHPALGGGFGVGFKIAGGYSFVTDNGTLNDSPDPLTTCIIGGHGTHVSGIVGMDPITDGTGFDIAGVAPEASIYMYRTFDCANSGGSDTIMAGMLRAQSDGVDIVSMSLSTGTQSIGSADPLSAVTQSLKNSGIAVVVAIGNEGVGSAFASNLFTADEPSADVAAIAVGAVANSEFPLVYSAVDSQGSTIGYASVWPLNIYEADVYLLADGCDPSVWEVALKDITNVNQTVIAFEVYNPACNPNSISWNSSPVKPAFIMALNTNNPSPYLLEYNIFSPGFFGNTQFVNVSPNDTLILENNYNQAGGYGNYKLTFNSSSFVSVPQYTGGLVDWYSNFGPDYFSYLMKPQISAPGGHILATWPLGPNSNYTIISGTSMATPYIAGCFALVKSQFPTATVDEILALLQTNSSPMKWVFDSTLLSATAQQGSGLVNVYNAIFSDTKVSPGQILISDVTHTEYGSANVTIENTSGVAQTYTISHQGAGYMDNILGYMEQSQKALYGTADFSTTSITIQAGQSEMIPFSILPPDGVTPDSHPVFGGFVQITSGSETLSVPYIGPPFSLYNAEYISVVQVASFTTDGVLIDNNISTINPANGFGIAADIPVQFTLCFEFHLLPANTSIIPTNYGYDTSDTISYVPSSLTPNSSFFGYESFGTYASYNRTTTPDDPLQPENFIQYWYDDTVTGPDGVAYSVAAYSEDFDINIALLRSLEYCASLLILVKDINIDLEIMLTTRRKSSDRTVPQPNRLQKDINDLIERQWDEELKAHEAAILVAKNKFLQLEAKYDKDQRALHHRIDEKEALLGNRAEEHRMETVRLEDEKRQMQLTIDKHENTIASLQMMKSPSKEQERNHELVETLRKEVSDKQIIITNLTRQNQAHETTIQEMQSRIHSYQKRHEVARGILLEEEDVIITAAHKTKLSNPMMSKSPKPKMEPAEVLNDLSARVTKPHKTLAKRTSSIDLCVMPNLDIYALDSIGTIKHWNEGKLDRSQPHVLRALQNAFKDKFGFTLTSQELSNLDRYVHGCVDPLHSIEMYFIFMRNGRDRDTALKRLKF
ncbi:hypothetical protein B7494_g4627 [Chlorociboria aeruginascens]|nr:hypothetical protein B7494_g4627 [Chlorociboria aeruginascens]